jgi:hypothetical protein
MAEPPPKRGKINKKGKIKMENEVDKKTEAKKPKADKVLVRIPFDELNKGDKFVPVCINGKIIQIKRGEDVYVSTQIREILKDARYI